MARKIRYERFITQGEAHFSGALCWCDVVHDPYVGGYIHVLAFNRDSNITTYEGEEYHA